jgi:hypothetical protein
MILTESVKSKLREKASNERVVEFSVGEIVDLALAPITAEDYFECQRMLEANFGVRYAKVKMDGLWAMLESEGWSGLRARQTTIWICKNLKFPNWTPADFLKAPLDSLRNYAWVLEECRKERAAGSSASAQRRMEGFEVAVDLVLWRYRGEGSEVPFKQVYPLQAK